MIGEDNYKHFDDRNERMMCDDGKKAGVELYLKKRGAACRLGESSSTYRVFINISHVKKKTGKREGSWKTAEVQHESQQTLKPFSTLFLI